MKQIIYLIKTVKPHLYILLAFSFIAILLIDLWLINKPEIFFGGYVFGQILYRCCLAYISSFIFYFFVVHSKTQNDKKNLRNFVERKLAHILSDSLEISDELKKQTKVKTENEYPTKEELFAILKQIDPNSPGPFYPIVPADKNTWIDFLLRKKGSTARSLERLYPKIQYLDSNLVTLLVDLHDNELFEILNLLQYKLGDKDLTTFQNSFLDYFEKVTVLHKYYNKYY